MSESGGETHFEGGRGEAGLGRGRGILSSYCSGNERLKGICRSVLHCLGMKLVESRESQGRSLRSSSSARHPKRDARGTRRPTASDLEPKK